MKQELEFKIEGKEWVSLQDAAFEKLNKKIKGPLYTQQPFENSPQRTHVIVLVGIIPQ